MNIRRYVYSFMKNPNGISQQKTGIIPVYVYVIDSYNVTPTAEPRGRPVASSM